MRSGTTLVQRLLAADPRLHVRATAGRCSRSRPRLDWDPDGGGPADRRGRWRARSRPRSSRAGPLRHPPDVRARGRGGDRLPRRRVPLARARVGRRRRGVPAAGSTPQDFAPAYDHLHRMLQLLQWQKRQRGEPATRAGCSRRRRTSATSTTCARTFPDLHLVHLHRDPVETIPSGASLNTTLHAMHADTVDPHRIGPQWLERMGWTNDRAMATRDRWGCRTRPVTDVRFEDAVADPIGEMGRVYDAAGLALTAEAEAAMRDWLERRPRETAPARLRPGDLRPRRRDDPRAVQRVRRALPGSLSIGRTCSSASRVSSPSRARSCGGGASLHTASAANTAPATSLGPHRRVQRVDPAVDEQRPDLAGHRALPVPEHPLDPLGAEQLGAQPRDLDHQLRVGRRRPERHQHRPDQVLVRRPVVQRRSGTRRRPRPRRRTAPRPWSRSAGRTCAR